MMISGRVLLVLNLRPQVNPHPVLNHPVPQNLVAALLLHLLHLLLNHPVPVLYLHLHPVNLVQVLRVAVHPVQNPVLQVHLLNLLAAQSPLVRLNHPHPVQNPPLVQAEAVVVLSLYLRIVMYLHLLLMRITFLKE
jgi:hypothetical protein